MEGHFVQLHFLITVCIQHFFVLVLGVQNFRQIHCPPGTIGSYYNVTDYTPPAALYMPRTIL